jgi:curved DNA-binding protein
MNDDHLPDYYEDLQISPNADSETIERVFRLLAKRCHPDNKDTGNADAFTRISSAYKVLSDAEKRASYDARHVAVKTESWKASETSSVPLRRGRQVWSSMTITIFVSTQTSNIRFWGLPP